ncbi:RHS repeat-associated core domain-containing protein, partial [Acinetobacter baumannii]
EWVHVQLHQQKGMISLSPPTICNSAEQRIDANRHSVAYQWDKQGRIQKLINQNQAEYLFGYNPYGYLIREQAFDGEEKHYSYNENGRIFQIRQPNILTQFDYYADGQIASKSFTHLHTGQKQTEQFDYNLNSQLSRASNEVSQIDFYRNALGQLVREHQHYKIPELKPLTAVLHYEYDELGNLIKTIRPDGHTLNHLVYGSGHIYAIGLNNQEVVSFQRDDLHRETTRLLANGLMQTKQYNDVGLLSSQFIQPEQETQDYLQYQAHRKYHYDKNYLLSQVEDSRLGKLNYQYDPIGRLIAAQSLHKTESFNFDPAGNLIDSDSVLSPAQIKNNLIKSYKGKHYQYDVQGNVTEIIQAGKNLKLTWDNQNRLIRSDNNGLVTEYGYDVFGRRLYKKTAKELTLFGWDGDLMIWESFKSAQTNYTKHYIYEPDSFVPLLQTGYKDFIQLIETPDYQEYQTKPYSIYKDPVWNSTTRKKRADLEQITFYHCDQVGTPQTMTNIRGECVWEILQDTWGAVSQIKALNQDNPFEQNNLRFQGQYYDQETELHYNRYRYYEPHSARYVSKDPIGLSGGINTSAYVSDPTQWIDPRGLASTNSIGSYGSVKSASDTYEKYATSKSLKDVAERYAAGKSVGGSATAGVGVGIYANYKGNGESTLTMERKVGLGYEYGVFERNYHYGERQVNRGYIEGCAATGESKYCAGSHTDKISPYIYKDEYKSKSKARGITISQGKEMVGNPNGPSIIHGPGHSWDLGAHGFPSTY